MEIIASSASGEMGISEIAAEAGLPLPTIHRLLRTLAVHGYVHQTPRRRYALGARLIPLAEKAGGALGATIRPILAELVERIGESASMAMVDLDHAIYIAHVPSERSMRMFTEVGRRAAMHTTGVGKALLSMFTDTEALAMVNRVGFTANTPHSITTPERLLADLALVRQRGFALDEEEQELGVYCVAVPVPAPIRLAISISGPSTRMTGRVVSNAVPLLRAAGQRVADSLKESAT